MLGRHKQQMSTAVGLFGISLMSQMPSNQAKTHTCTSTHTILCSFLGEVTSKLSGLSPLYFSFVLKKSLYLPLPRFLHISVINMVILNK